MIDQRWSRTIFICFCLLLVARGWKVRWATERPDRVNTELDFELQEVSAQVGLNFQHEQLSVPRSNIAPWIQAIGAAVAVTDVDNDGFMDIYLTQARVGSPNQLYRNQGDGTFKEQAAKYGLAFVNDRNISIRPIFFDCDNDGRSDLFLTTGSCPKVLRNLGGRFALGQVFKEGCYVSEGVSTWDFNGDGFLDLITGGVNGDGQAFRTLPANFVDARNGSTLDVFINNGRCEFERADGWVDAKGRFFYHSIGIGDLRDTGMKDLWVATDFNSDKIFLQSEQGYRLHTIEGTNSRFGMNTEVLYLEGQGPPFVFVTHTYKTGYMLGGNMLWRFDGKDFRDHALEKGLRKCGWAWSGRAVDLNNDGDLDLAVANGYVSGDPKQDYWYSFSVLGSTASMVSSQSRFWPDMNGKNFSGHERDCLFINQGGRFVDVADQAGLDPDRLDGRAVAVIDATNSGQQDLIVVNQNSRLNYYRVRSLQPKNWIGFRMHSERGAREALGTVVTVTSEGRRLRRELFTTNSYAAQSDPRLHFGLGLAKTVEQIEIRWPSGRIARMGPMAINQYHDLSEGTHARDEL